MPGLRSQDQRLLHPAGFPPLPILPSAGTAQLHHPGPGDAGSRTGLQSDKQTDGETLAQGEDTTDLRASFSWPTPGVPGPAKQSVGQASGLLDVGRREGVRESMPHPSPVQRPGSKGRVGSLPGGLGLPIPCFLGSQ